MNFTEDLTAFFRDFGEQATVGGEYVDCIYDNAYAAVLGFTAGTGPLLVCAAADVPTVAQGAAVHVARADYTVTAIEPDGTGLVLLRLQEA